MSVICGVVGTDGRPWTTADVEGVLDMQVALGPDGTGSWEGTTGRCAVALAVALRHTTPEDATGSQPIRIHDGSLVLVGDLRVDNRGEVAGLLGIPEDGSTSDGELVLRAYERWGKSMLERIVGDFALAIVDRRRGGVLLARDHMGARPIVVHERHGVVAFASMPLALTALEGVGHDLDVHHAAETLALAYTSERTFVAGVRWLPAGTAAWIDAGGIRRWKWWDPDPHETLDLDLTEHAAALREAFQSAVVARLRSAGPVGASASGGLDSTSAAATAAEQLAPASLPTFTAAPPPGWSGSAVAGWDADESHLVRDLARMHPNISPTFVHVAEGSGLFGVHEAMWELGAGPAANPANTLWIHAVRARAASMGITSLLTGDFGNLFFSADGPDWLASLLRVGRMRHAVREAARWRRSSGDGWYRVLRGHLAGPLAPPALARLARRARNVDDRLKEWVSATALRPELVSGLDLPALLPQIDEGRRRDRRDVALSVRGHYAGQADTAHALWATTGVEARDPTADRRVLEVAMRQPEWVRRSSGTTRAVARAAMSDRLPVSIVQRTRRGEQLPEWLDVMTTARAEIAAELDHAEAHATSRELIDVERLRALVARWPERSKNGDPEVVRDYRLALFRALLVSRYLRWFESRSVRRR